MIRITTGLLDARVDFPYDTEAVAIIKTVPGHRWHPDTKHWTISPGAVRVAALRFYERGFAVTIDGRPFSPAAAPPRAAAGDPFAALLRTLPPPLRQPAYRALARVLHPDAGGTTTLMQALNQAHKETTT